jgi:quinol monooxygenase YgiN
MYGTVARMQLKPGNLEKMQALVKEYETLRVPGHVSTVVFQMDKDSNELYMAVAFASKDEYVANANDPAQNTRYQQMIALLAGEPEWHDGEVVYQMT